MTTDDETPTWPAAAFFEQAQSMSDEAIERQGRLFDQWMSAMTGSPASRGGLPPFPMGLGMATFKTRVQSGGRISIPDAEREALDIDEGDIVQAIIVPIKRGTSNNE